MSKYIALGEYLRAQKFERVPMSFAEIERVVKFKLPPSKKHRAWWSNNPTNNVMTRQWLDAGYETTEVDIEKERLTFLRKSPPQGPKADPTRKASIFGCLKGLVTFAPGFDLAEPAFAEDDFSAELLYQNRGRK